MDEKMVLRYTLTEEDYVKFNIYHYKHSDYMKRGIVFWRIIWSGLILVIGYFMLRNLDSGSLFIALIPVLGLSAFVFFYYPTVIFRSLRKNIKNLTADVTGERLLLLCDDKFRVERENQATESAYNSIKCIIIYDESLYIYVDKSNAYVLPFSAFESEAQKAEFIKILTEKSGQEIKNG